MPSCTDIKQFVAKFWLYIVNILLILVGAVMAGIGGMGIASMKELGESESGEALTLLFSRGALEMMVAGGGLTIFIGILGIYAAKHSTAAVARFVLFFYGGLMLLIIILEIAGAGVALTWAGKLEEYEASPAVTDKMDASIAKIDAALQKAKDVCCAEDLDNDAISQGCKLIKPVIKPKDGASGCDDFDTFKANFIQYANRKGRSAAGFGMFVGVLQLLALISACYLVKNKGDDGEEGSTPSNYGSTFSGGKSA